MASTIAAISTAPGEGGIGIIRISGSESKRILDDIFLKKSSGDMVSHMLYYGHIFKPGEEKIVDEVMAVYMKSPSTYTKEDVVEIHSHGSIASLNSILKIVIERGASVAERGEFTKRAFLNGRIDLSQAEAVIDLIKADTSKKLEIAVNQLQGNMSLNVRKIRNLLLEILAQIMVNIDFPDEDIEQESYENLMLKSLAVKDRISTIISDTAADDVYKNGIKIALIGRPNVGKSSLLNAILEKERAIVTEIPGTTRDTISERTQIGDIPIEIIDTAGIRDTQDLIERMGIERSKQAFNEADIVLMILDVSNNISKEEEEIIEALDPGRSIIFLNKQDLIPRISSADVRKILSEVNIIEGSVKNSKGILETKEMIISLASQGECGVHNENLLGNARQYEALIQAEEAMRDAIKAIELEEPFEIIELDVKDCYEILGRIIGEGLGEDIIDEVFSKFCLGK